ncbi:helix-turn-helix domain-containing protein [Pseudarthrobacter sp. GA104]|uniref:helix-turn-helix domain-containing protein n=1 Tax=Pseudarthrobacter sp. GA104 TaxID=2676311 RepID=UPI0012FB8B43|nr:helix-turn-helix domain-containing protein [Pseudarthrobacter sp. GA104]MUU70531.1 excisionase family DNA-binding protein [Pseudarthrobacter sp. GA104]
MVSVLIFSWHFWLYFRLASTLTIEQAAEELNVKESLIRGLIKAGDLRALQVGGRGYLAR